MQDYRNPSVWQKAHQLTVAVYAATGSSPQSELYGLTSQTRRACVSIPANIAEGCGRGGRAELGRFLRIAMGSACELEYHLLLSHDLKFLEDESHSALGGQTSEVKRMLTALIRKLKADTGLP